MESVKDTLSAEKCARAASQEFSRKGCTNDGETKFSPIRYDDTSTN